MANNVVVVTGAGSGFGKLTVLEPARQGHTVIATMRDVRNGAVRDELIHTAKAQGNPPQVLEMDVADDASVDTAIASVIAPHGRIEMLVNDAGLIPIGVTEAYRVAAGSGLLVQVTSLMGRFTIPFFGIYAASKFALEALAKTYRYEFSTFGIDSVIVEVGPFPGNLISSSPQPSDVGVLASYGEIAAIPGQIKAGADQQFDPVNPPRPQLVADAIATPVADGTGHRSAANP